VAFPCAAVQREGQGALALREELLGGGVGHDHNNRRLLDASTTPHDKDKYAILRMKEFILQPSLALQLQP
jgi:hypothetical protein